MTQNGFVTPRALVYSSPRCAGDAMKIGRSIAIPSLIVLFVCAASCDSCRGRAPSADRKGMEAGSSAGPRITFITWNEDYLPALKGGVPRFEQETGIQVDWQILSEDVVREKVLVDLASGEGKYDLVLTDVWILPEHVASNYLEPLDAFATADRSFDRNLWFPTYLDALSLGGHLYALPTESFGAALVYRRDLFERYRVKVPTTIPELIAAAKKLTLDTDGDGRIDIYGVASRGKAGEEPAIVVSGFASAYGGSWFEGGAATAEEIRRLKAKPAFTSPEFTKGFTVYCDLLKKYGPPDSKNYTWYELVQDGRQGRAAMLLYSGFNVGAVDKAEVGMREKYAAALPVRGPKGYVQEAFAMGYGINRHSRHKDAAWAFLKFITGGQFMRGVVDNYATSIPMRALLEGAKYRAMHPYRAPDGRYVLEESIDLIDWRYMPHLPEYSVIADLLGTATSQVIAGEKAPAQALGELSRAVETLMQQAGYYED